MKQAYIFDFFGVICSEIAPVWLHSALPDSDAQKIHDELIVPVDRGSASETELFNTLGMLSKKDSAQVLQEWQELARIDQEVVTLIEELKKTSKIGLCSNAWSTFIRPILKKENLSRLFEAVTISSEVGHTKPDRQMYVRTAEALRVPPQECVFVDDQMKNIVGAEKLGMTGIHFVSTENLRIRLGL
jgi:HAD superfamily hydrolase (TIGR01509 family)